MKIIMQRAIPMIFSLQFNSIRLRYSKADLKLHNLKQAHICTIRHHVLTSVYNVGSCCHNVFGFKQVEPFVPIDYVVRTCIHACKNVFNTRAFTWFYLNSFLFLFSRLRDHLVPDSETNWFLSWGPTGPQLCWFLSPSPRPTSP